MSNATNSPVTDERVLSLVNSIPNGRFRYICGVLVTRSGTKYNAGLMKDITRDEAVKYVCSFRDL